MTVRMGGFIPFPRKICTRGASGSGEPGRAGSSTRRCFSEDAERKNHEGHEAHEGRPRFFRRFMSFMVNYEKDERKLQTRGTRPSGGRGFSAS
jgi:hypothetical protein